MYKLKSRQKGVHMFAPYIGITDFMSGSQAKAAAGHFAEHAEQTDRKLMIGVMMSFNTLHSLPSKWTAAFPKNEDVAEIFTPHPLVLNTLHYADYKGVDVAQSLHAALSFAGKHVHALQLDMIWPDPGAIRACRDNWPYVQVILQVNAPALEQIGNQPSTLIQRLREYGECVDGVLFDKSMGKGKGLDAEFLLPLMRRVHEDIPALRLAVAGGLGPETTHLVAPLLKEFRSLSWDAQSRLRKTGSALDPIDWDLARAYVELSCAMIHDREFHHHP